MLSPTGEGLSTEGSLVLAGASGAVEGTLGFTSPDTLGLSVFLRFLTKRLG